MPRFLFCVEVPPCEKLSNVQTHSPAWLALESAANNILKPLKNTTRLALNSWLIDAEKNAPVLFQLASLANDADLPYSIVLIPDGSVILALNQKD